MNEKIKDRTKMKLIWTQKIVLFQFLTVVFLVLLYILYGNIKQSQLKIEQLTEQFDNLSAEEEQITTQIDEMKEINQKLEKVFNWNQLSFINAYNSCYWATSGQNNTNILECMTQNWFDTTNFSEKEIKTIAISMMLYNDKSEKMDFDQKRVLRNLNEFIYNENLAEKVWAISFWKPILVDYKRNLYKVRFTISTTVDNFSWFIALLNKFENQIPTDDTNKVFYNITDLSSYNLNAEAQTKPQNINIWWYFYFTK